MKTQWGGNTLAYLVHSIWLLNAVYLRLCFPVKKTLSAHPTTIRFTLGATGNGPHSAGENGSTKKLIMHSYSWYYNYMPYCTDCHAIYTRSKKISPKNRKDFGMACHIPPLKKAKKQVEMPLPSLGPIPLKNLEFRDGMGPRLGNGISPCFFVFFCFKEKFFASAFRERMKRVASLK